MRAFLWFIVGAAAVQAICFLILAMARRWPDQPDPWARVVGWAIDFALGLWAAYLLISNQG